MTYRELEREFERKVRELQKRCKHEKLSDWITDGVPTPLYHERICEICHKVVNRRARCAKCRELVEEKDWVEGDGKARPLNEVLCKGCDEKWTGFIERYLKEHPYVPGLELKVIRVTKGGEVEKWERLTYDGYRAHIYLAWSGYFRRGLKALGDIRRRGK